MVAITETWLADNVHLNGFNNCISDFNVFRHDRISGRGGGVLLAIASFLKCKFIESFSVCNCECVFVDVLLNNSVYVRYGVVYRPPDTNIDTSLLLYKKILAAVGGAKHYVLLGDYNLPDINWSNHTAASLVSKEFLTLCFRLGAKQCVDFSTRNDNIIDLVLCSDRDLIRNVHPCVPFYNSDHDSIIFETVCNREIPTTCISKPLFKKADYTLINAFLATLDWDIIFSSCDTTEQYWCAFKNILNEVVHNFVPFSANSCNKSKPWFNKNLSRLKAVKQRRWRAYKKNKNIVSYSNYKTAADMFHSEITSSKRSYERNLFNNRKIKSNNFFYNYVKKQNSIKGDIPFMKNNDGTLTSTDDEKASMFSKYFASVFIKDDGCLPHFSPNCNSELLNFTCSAKDVILAIKSLDGSSSPGIDNFTPFFLKNILAQIANPLTVLFNRSLSEGKIPQDWKNALVVPIFKKGDRQSVKNYRPISLTSILCKTLERIIKKQLMCYLLHNDLIPKEQHGFLPKKSTTSNLVECLDHWTSNFDQGLQTDVIYLDYSKCFDTVSHKKLLFKLSGYGLGGSALKWIESFLIERKQCVKLNSTFSPFVDVTSGVPQGSVLGPVLFLIFSADVKQVIKHSKFSVYADDIKLFRSIKSVGDCNFLQQDLDSVSRWSTIWQLKLNCEKTKCLKIGNVKFSKDYSIYNNVIDTVVSMSDLGVIIQSDLKFTTHCSNITRKAYFVIRRLFNTFKGHDCDFYVFMYNCYVRPILESSSQAWSPFLKGNIDTVERVQKFFTKRLPGFKFYPYADRLRILQMDSLESRRIMSDLILFKKLCNGDICINLKTNYNFISSYRGNGKTLFKFRYRTERRGHFWINRIVNIWNNLPPNIVSINSIQLFKKEISKLQLSGRGSMYCV